MTPEPMQLMTSGGAQLPVRQAPSPASILQAVVEKGITAENAAVVEKLVEMCRQVRSEEAKTAFAAAFFKLRGEMPRIFADKEVKTDGGKVAFVYCSPDEIKNILEPLLFKHGFCTMAGQTQDDKGVITVTVTLVHEAGHSESRSFSVRVSPGNRLMSPTQCDAAASTSAERHALIKMFQLRTRKTEDDDASLVGDRNAKVTTAQAGELEKRAQLTNSNIALFLKFAGADKFSNILANRYEACNQMLKTKESKGR